MATVFPLLFCLKLSLQSHGCVVFAAGRDKECEHSVAQG